MRLRTETVAPTVICPSRCVKGLSTNLISFVFLRDGRITSAVALVDLTIPRMACVGMSGHVPLTAPSPGSLAPGDARLPRSTRPNGGQPDREARAASNAALHLDPSFLAIDDPFHQAQAKTRPLDRRRSRRIPAVEALEDLSDHARCH